MRTDVSQDALEFYRENGYLVIEGFLSSGELEEWRECTEEAVAQRLAKVAESDRNIPLQNQGDPDAYYAQVFIQCIRLADTHAGMRRLMLDPKLGRLMAKVAGIEGIRIWHDQALIKQPFGNPTSFHLDNPYWSFSDRNSLSIWVALDDVTLSNGCLYYLPGTHRTARFDNAGIGPNLGDLFKIYPEWRSIEPVACPCPAGSAVIHNGLTAHGAGANMTTRPRRAMTCAYMPAGATFNGTRNILTEDYFSSLKIGDVLNNEDQNPMVWSKKWEADVTA